MVKVWKNLKSRIEEVKNIPICDLIYKTLYSILLNYYQK